VPWTLSGAAARAIYLLERSSTARRRNRNRPAELRARNLPEPQAETVTSVTACHRCGQFLDNQRDASTQPIVPASKPPVDSAARVTCAFWLC